MIPESAQDQEDFDSLEALGNALSKSRSDAIKGRQSSGIEEVWEEDEEHYEGIDDANRTEVGSWSSKPAGQAGLEDEESAATGSTIFFNITGPYCDAASARIADMLSPTDDKGWVIGPTPIPELDEIAEGKIPPQMMTGFEQQAGANPEALQAKVDQTANRALQIIEEAKRSAEKASTQIDDWHTEGQYNAEMRQVIEDASKVGTGVLKGPIPERKRAIVYRDGEIQISEKIIPVSKCVRVDNCFPDPGCGTSIHHGQYHWERDEISEKDLYDLIGSPDYMEDQILGVLRDGPYQAVKEFNDDKPGIVRRDKSKLFEIWYYYGRLSKEDMEDIGCGCDEYPEQVDICVTMVNNRVIKAVPNHLDTGEFPYDYMVWKRRVDSPFGIGVSRQIRDAQRMVKASVRNLMDNAGMAGGPMWIFLSGLVEPIDGVYEIKPWKGWRATEDADMDDIRKAFFFVEIPMIQEQLQAIVQLGLKMAEDITGLPMLLQGQQGSAPETLGGTQLLNNNASTVLRRLARLWDDLVTVPQISRYYRFLLQYGDDDEAKGDHVIEARGSSALIERDAQSQALVQLSALVVNPIFGKDPKKWMDEYLRSQRFDPENLNFDDEEWQQTIQNMSQPQDSSMQVAQIRAEMEKYKTDVGAQIKQMEMQVGSQDKALDREDKERDREVQIIGKSTDQQLKQQEIIDKKENEINKLKAELAKVTMTLRTQKELSGTEAATPVVEPKGRAEEGRSFEQ
jgi:hypothetical protein